MKYRKLKKLVRYQKLVCIEDYSFYKKGQVVEFAGLLPKENVGSTLLIFTSQVSREVYYVDHKKFDSIENIK